IREWWGPPWLDTSLAIDFVVERPSRAEGTSFVPKVLAFPGTAAQLDKIFSGSNGSFLQPSPQFSLGEMTENEKEAFWDSVTSGDYALELLPDPRRLLHSFEFETAD